MGNDITKALISKMKLCHTGLICFHNPGIKALLVPKKLEEQAKSIIGSGDLNGILYLIEVIKINSKKNNKKL